MKPLSQKEMNRLEVMQKLLSRQWKQEKAALFLRISIRQVQRLLYCYRRQGQDALISKKRASPGNCKMSDSVKQSAVTLIKRHYSDFGPTLAAEKLFEKYDIRLSVETVRVLMMEHNIWTTRIKRAARSFQPRYRRERFGELIQIDGSTHHWFEDRGSRCTLMPSVG